MRSVDEHSLELLEFPRVTAAVAALAECEAARSRLRAARPIAGRAERERACARLDEAIRRIAESGEWCRVGRGEAHARLDRDRREGLDPEGLLEVLSWLEAGSETRSMWTEEETRQRLPELAALVDGLPPLDELRKVLADALEPDGRVSDRASAALASARAELAHGERSLERRLEQWTRGFGENAFVTRHGERFVALVPAAGFSRRSAIIHDTSGSGQSLFVEPLEVCEENNRLTELRRTVTEEERRIVIELAERVRAEGEPLRRVEEGLVELDSLRARARWARDTRGVAIAPGGERLRLKAARHPLLATGERRESVVPLDLELGPEGRLLLVSGPNMGGKTVLLKTVGLAVALSHAAFPVPADAGSAVPEMDGMLVDLGDEQSVDRGLSTFAAHLKVLAAMADQAGPRRLLLCDELGAGTDPEEGGALGRALIEHFAARGAFGVMTTHLGSLKRAAGEVEGVRNGSLEFDEATLTPRFRFLPDVPGASHALSVAERLGFPREVLDRARAGVPEAARALERLLSEVQEARRAALEETASLRAARLEAEQAAARHDQATQESRRTLEELRRRLTRESQALLARARELWQTVQREARRAEKSRTGAEGLRRGMEEVEREAEVLERSALEALPAGDPARAPVALEPGGRVRVTDLGLEAELVSPPDSEGKVVLQRGSWTIHSHVSRLAPSAAGAAGGAAPDGGSAAAWDAGEGPVSLEVDLRGMEVEEALRTLDEGLDRAVVSGLTELRIVHGIGRGVLRAAVERHLRGHPQVADQRLGVQNEGGRGATVAKLR